MGRTRWTLLPMAVIAAGVFFGVAVAAVPTASEPLPQGTQAVGDYAGQETCLECHEEMGATLTGSRHARAVDGRTPAATLGCESCHGPGRAHAESGDPDLMTSFAEKLPTEVNDSCTTCHNKGEQAFWDGSGHEGRDVTCVSCHSVHDAEADDAQLVLPTQTVTCAQCHQDKVAQVQRTTHMPLREGTMECTSCHNPHGSVNDRMLAEGFTLNESCTTSCHAEKRGPFMWEHAAVVEDCSTCHDPHGSVNDRMLVAKQPMLCQRCHNHTRHPPRVYDAVAATTAPQAFARSCINCHQTIHGSNHPSGKRFLR